ncbi:MAG: hypothetical protein U0165_12990 [Polyangiaceae bacterium]
MRPSRFVPLAAVVTTLFLSQIAFADATAPDAVLTVDGRLIEGTITERVENQYVVINTPTGSRRITWDQIKRVDQSSNNPADQEGRSAPPSNGPIGSRTDTWASRGSTHLTFGVDALGDALFQEGRTVDNVPEGRRLGFGGGAGARVGFLTFATPDFEGNSGNWYGWRFGSGADVSYVAASAPGEDSLNKSSYLVKVPLYFGGQFGFGSLPSSREWKGVMFGIDYRPSYLRVKYADAPAQGILNWAGFDMTLDFATMHPDSSPEMQLRIVGSMYFPVVEKLWSGSIGVGLAWY